MTRHEAGPGAVSNDRVARLLLGRIGEPGDVALTKVISKFGASAALEQVRTGSMQHAGVANLRARLDVADPERDLAAGALSARAS